MKRHGDPSSIQMNHAWLRPSVARTAALLVSATVLSACDSGLQRIDRATNEKLRESA